MTESPPRDGHMLTQDKLKELLHYDPETGIFTWKESRGKGRAGISAGSVVTHGYIKITILRRAYFAHRLAFLYVLGRAPENVIDHINGVAHDNRWANLRECTVSDNGQNSKIPIHNSSGIKNVRREKYTGKWRVELRAKGDKKYLGAYTDLELAELIAIEAREKFHGEFARHG